MSRKQILQAFTPVSSALANTAEPITLTENYVKSVLIQATVSNTDFVYVGDSTIQSIAIAPGKAVEIHGDNLGHGDAAMFDLSSVYFKTNVQGEGVSFVILAGV